MGLRMLFWLRRDERKILEQIRELKTLKVTPRGGMSIDPLEIIQSDHFLKASRMAKRIVERDSR